MLRSRQSITAHLVPRAERRAGVQQRGRAAEAGEVGGPELESGGVDGGGKTDSFLGLA